LHPAPASTCGMCALARAIWSMPSLRIGIRQNEYVRLMMKLCVANLHAVQTEPVTCSHGDCCRGARPIHTALKTQLVKATRVHVTEILIHISANRGNDEGLLLTQRLMQEAAGPSGPANLWKHVLKNPPPRHCNKVHSIGVHQTVHHIRYGSAPPTTTEQNACATRTADTTSHQSSTGHILDISASVCHRPAPHGRWHSQPALRQ
jgi:hypothetical protein